MSTPIGESSRAGFACSSCRQRKVKCDQALPKCGTCARNASECLYEIRPATVRPIRFVPFNPSRIAQPETSNPVDNEGELPDPAATVSIPVEQLASLELKIERLAELVKLARRQSDRGMRAVPEVELGYEEPAENRAGHLSADKHGRVRYVEKTFWGLICDQVFEIDKVLRHDIVAVPQSGTTSPSAFLPEGELDGDIFSRSIYEVSHSTQMDHFAKWKELLLQELPPWNVCDFLIHIFISGYHPIVPLLDIASFTSSYENLWIALGQSDSLGADSIKFIPLLVAVLYAGAAICPPIELHDAIAYYMTTNPAVLVHNMHRLTIRILRLAYFPRAPTVETLAAYVLCQGTWMREEQPLDCSAFIGLIVHTAYTLGLHREPRYFPSLAPQDMRTRRLLWWHIVHIDVEMSLISGLPPVVDLQTSDVAPLNEELTDSLTASKFNFRDLSARNESETVVYLDDHHPQKILLSGKMQSMISMQKFLVRVLDKRAPGLLDLNPIVRYIRALEHDMTKRSQMLHPYLSVLVHEPEVEAIAAWTIDLLQVLTCRAWILLYPITNQYNTQAFAQLRNLLIAKSQEMLLRVVRMSCMFTSRYYVWSWPGNHQPLHAIAILLKEILANTGNNDHTASFNAIEAISALFCPGQGLVGGASEPILIRPLSLVGQTTWAEIQKLKWTAWEQFGRSHANVWTRQEALNYATVTLGPLDSDVPSSAGMDFFWDHPNQQMGDFSDIPLNASSIDLRSPPLAPEMAEWLSFELLSPDTGSILPSTWHGQEHF